MEEALRLARYGLYTTMPNPRVGCVLVKNGHVIGRGWHKTAGSRHAEVNAVFDTEQSIEGATAYVTLEPCSHFGKTGPCCDLLIKSGVKTVVVAMEDPNPEVAGAGIKRLEEAGIRVINGVLAESARALNKGFFKRMETGLPHVRCKMAMSLDGRTAMASGESQWITGSDARERVQKLRAQSCAIVTGIGSILRDDSSLTVRKEQLGVLDTNIDRAKVLARQPLRVVVDSSLRIPLNAKILSQPGVTVIATTERNPDVEAELQNRWGVECVCFPSEDGKVNLKRLMQYLADRQCNEVLVETGATLAGSFLQNSLIDEFIFYMAPKMMGSQAHGLFNVPFKTLSHSYQLQIQDIYAVGEDWCIEAVPDSAFREQGIRSLHSER
jgi:diaminohydroxyphosphoribosylaminopyrimidine deaminase/5-amino-6-(5-phosphoribosylamino)uracil reductase